MWFFRLIICPESDNHDSWAGMPVRVILNFSLFYQLLEELYIYLYPEQVTCCRWHFCRFFGSIKALIMANYLQIKLTNRSKIEQFEIFSKCEESAKLVNFKNGTVIFVTSLKFDNWKVLFQKMREIRSGLILLSAFANSVHAISRVRRAFGGPNYIMIRGHYACDNGGSWNHSLQRCDCPSGFTGKTNILSAR